MNTDFVTPDVEIANLILGDRDDYTYDARANVFWSLTAKSEKWGIERLDVIVDRVDISGYVSDIESGTEEMLEKTYEQGWEDFDIYADFDENFQFPLRPISVIINEPEREITVQF